jgi:hypothetical protein
MTQNELRYGCCTLRHDTTQFNVHRQRGLCLKFLLFSNTIGPLPCQSTLEKKCSSHSRLMQLGSKLIS